MGKLAIVLKMKHFLIFTFFFAVLGNIAAFAQTSSQADEQFANFSLARLGDDAREIIMEGEKLMAMLDKFMPARRTFIMFYLANAYEKNAQLEKAAPLYRKVIEAEPDYYVAHRAMGYYYLHKGEELKEKMDAAESKAERRVLKEEYRRMLLQALPHLEKDYACDPYPESLAVIKKLIKNIGPAAKRKGLSERIAKLSENCVTLLPDE
jgi:Tfp pilus assembly protein PilF